MCGSALQLAETEYDRGLTRGKGEGASSRQEQEQQLPCGENVGVGGGAAAEGEGAAKGVYSTSLAEAKRESAELPGNLLKREAEFQEEVKTACAESRQKAGRDLRFVGESDGYVMRD